MLRNITSCSFLVVMIMSYIICADQTDCSNCTGIRDCVPFMNFIKTQPKPLPPLLVKFLKERQCGFEDGFPKVCCGEIPKELKNNNANDKRTIKKNNLSAIHGDNAEPKVTTTKRPKKKTRKIPEEMLYDFPRNFLDDVMGSFSLLRKKRDCDNTCADVEIR